MWPTNSQPGHLEKFPSFRLTTHVLIVLHLYGQDHGTPFSISLHATFIQPLSRNHERITNEAKALELAARETTIPVPRLLDHGIHPDGRRYLVTELIEGLTLDEFQNRPC